MACGERWQPPCLLNLHSFGLVASLVNTLPKWPLYGTGYRAKKRSGNIQAWLMLCVLFSFVVVVFSIYKIVRPEDAGKIASLARHPKCWGTANSGVKLIDMTRMRFRAKYCNSFWLSFRTFCSYCHYKNMCNIHFSFFTQSNRKKIISSFTGMHQALWFEENLRASWLPFLRTLEVRRWCFQWRIYSKQSIFNETHATSYCELHSGDACGWFLLLWPRSLTSGNLKL